MACTPGADAAQALMASAPVLELVADPASHAVLSIKAISGDFNFVDGDGDHNRLTMMNGALQWMCQNQGGWRTLSSGALTLQAATGALFCSEAHTCVPLAEVQKLLLVAQTETLSHVTIHGVTGEVDFVDADGDRNRLVMMDGKLQWQTINGATGWQVLSEGPVVLDQLSGSLQVSKATARMRPEDLNRLLLAARLCQDKAVPAQSSQKPPLAPAQSTRHPPMQAPVMMDMRAMVQNSSGPVQGVCPACKHQVVTIVTHEFGTGSAVTSCCLCCCCAMVGGLIPCCVPDLQDAHHRCPNCQKEVGVKTFLF